MGKIQGKSHMQQIQEQQPCWPVWCRFSCFSFPCETSKIPCGSFLALVRELKVPCNNHGLQLWSSLRCFKTTLPTSSWQLGNLIQLLSRILTCCGVSYVLHHKALYQPADPLPKGSLHPSSCSHMYHPITPSLYFASAHRVLTPPGLFLPVNLCSGTWSGPSSAFGGFHKGHLLSACPST